ncbi:MAG: ferritin [Planctomycetota bacterium]
MISEKMLKLLNDQVNLEMSSAYLYLSMATWFEDINLSGFAHWMKEQFNEEMEHAAKIMEYIQDQRCRVTLQAIPAPKLEWQSPLEAFEDAFKHEQHVTASILYIVEEAVKEHDRATQNFLNWFVDEQVEEEKNTDDVVQKLKMLGDAKHALYMLDRELAKREG